MDQGNLSQASRMYLITVKARIRTPGDASPTVCDPAPQQGGDIKNYKLARKGQHSKKEHWTAQYDSECSKKATLLYDLCGPNTIRGQVRTPPHLHIVWGKKGPRTQTINKEGRPGSIAGRAKKRLRVEKRDFDGKYANWVI